MAPLRLQKTTMRAHVRRLLLSAEASRDRSPFQSPTFVRHRKILTSGQSGIAQPITIARPRSSTAIDAAKPRDYASAAACPPVHPVLKAAQIDAPPNSAALPCRCNSEDFCASEQSRLGPAAVELRHRQIEQVDGVPFFIPPRKILLAVAEFPLHAAMHP